MAKEVIEAIFLAEKEAADILKKAKVKADLSARNLATEAKDLKDSLWAEAQSKIDAILNSAREKAETEAAPRLEEAKTKASVFNQIDPKLLDKVVKFVMDKVTSYGNR